MPKNKKTYTSLTAVIENLEKMNLDAMAEQLKEMDKSGELTNKSPLEVLDQLISFQSIEDQNNTTERYKKKAKLYSPLADLQDVLYIPARHLNAALIDQLATNQYIDNSRNVMITSATGCGKTWISNAFCINALRQFKTVRYVKTSNILYEIEKADLNNQHLEYITSASQLGLLVLDDFGLMPLDPNMCRNLFVTPPMKWSLADQIECP